MLVEPRQPVRPRTAGRTARPGPARPTAQDEQSAAAVDDAALGTISLRGRFMLGLESQTTPGFKRFRGNLRIDSTDRLDIARSSLVKKVTFETMTDLFENPIGLDGFEFVEFCAPEKGVLEPVFKAMGFHPRRHAPLQGRAAVAAGADQPHRQLRTAQRRMVSSRANMALRPAAWASACATLRRPMTSCWHVAPSRSRSKPARWNCTSRRSAASAARSSI